MGDVLIPIYLDVSLDSKKLYNSKLTSLEFQEEDEVPFGFFKVKEGYILVMGHIDYTCSNTCHLCNANTEIYWSKNLKGIYDNAMTPKQRRLVKPYLKIER
jgi:aminoglycoside N3'-acetyltransferase